MNSAVVQAMGITREHNGADLTRGPLHIRSGAARGGIRVTTRVGIREGADLPLRFYLEDCPFISRK